MIYLDNAATSFPKPSCVQREVLCALTRYGGNPGRGSHRLSLAAANKIFSCREELAAFLGLGSPERVIFTQNTTHALNLAIKGLLRTGSHVLISELEHNAVRRPLAAMQKKGELVFETFPVLGRTQDEILAGIAQKCRPNTAAVIATHASNICSVTLPIGQIGRFCRAHKLLFLVDAAQSAGHLPIDMTAMCIDALAAPGHKGLYGIQGCGLLALGENAHPNTLIEGGSGLASLPDQMPDELPERYEAGTLPTPSIAGLLAGLCHIRSIGIESIEKSEAALFRAARERLSSLPDIEIYAPEYEGGILLFNKKGVPCTLLSEELDRKGICVRAGLHCAPLAHAALHTPQGGALRVSFGIFNTVSELDALWNALKA